MYQLREYQERALNELFDWLSRHPQGNPVFDACVGAGKSIMIAELCKRAIAMHSETRIVMCVASKELCEQNLAKLKAIWTDAPAGVCSASLGERDTDSQIIFSTIGSIYKRAHELGKVHILLIDECHNVNPDNAGMYRDFISSLQRYGSPQVCIIGFTGTPFRGDGVWLWQGKDPLFAGTATRVTMDELLGLGYLSPLVVDKSTPQMIDTSSVKVSGSDYVVKDLSNVANQDAIVKAAVADIVERGKNRKKWLVFCVTIEHAENVLSEIEAHGITCAIVTSKTPQAERANYLDCFKKPSYDKASIKCLVNVACLTTGFDAPETDLIALLRPTKSPVLYVQIAGRGMRIHDNKLDCLWLDYTSTTDELGAVNRITGRNKSKSTMAGIEPVKFCDECGNPNRLGVYECAECGAEFEISEKDIHDTKAANAEILSGHSEPERQMFEVQEVGYFKHHGKGDKPPTLRIDYFHSIFDHPISEWKCFEHDGYALQMGSQWWANHSELDVPLTVDDALELIHTRGFRVPSHIEVIKEGKFWRITGYGYDGDAPEIISTFNQPSAALVAEAELPF